MVPRNSCRGIICCCSLYSARHEIANPHQITEECPQKNRKIFRHLSHRRAKIRPSTYTNAHEAHATFATETTFQELVSLASHTTHSIWFVYLRVYTVHGSAFMVVHTVIGQRHGRAMAAVRTMEGPPAKEARTSHKEAPHEFLSMEGRRFHGNTMEAPRKHQWKHHTEVPIVVHLYTLLG